MSALTMLVLSGSCLGVLGLIAACVRRARAEALPPAPPADARERALHETAKQLFDAALQSSDAVLAALDRRVRAIDAVDAVLVFVPSGDELACTYASGARAEHFRRSSVRRDDARLPARAARDGCRAAVPGGDPLLPTDRAAFAAPMHDGRVLRAVVYASSSTVRRFACEDVLVRAVEYACAPYVVAQEREADRADATYDGLTGILTPRAFRRRLHDEIARAARGGEALSLWFVDTDRFKGVNDRFGHRAGDGVLVAMARLLAAHAVPGVDLTARNGGDEFCALVRAASKSAAIERAQSFCESVRAHDFGLALRVTASVGVASFPCDAGSSNELLETADAAMYHAKRHGRDRVAFALERGSYAIYER